MSQFVIKRSTVPQKTPTLDDLMLGELATNIPDERFFYRNSNEVKDFSAAIDVSLIEKGTLDVQRGGTGTTTATGSGNTVLSDAPELNAAVDVADLPITDKSQRVATTSFVKDSIVAYAAVAPLFTYEWVNASRLDVPVGTIPCDGQQVSILMFPEAVTDVLAGKQAAVTEEEWQSDISKRDCWSLGDGKSWVRVPDLNTKTDVDQSAYMYVEGCVKLTQYGLWAVRVFGAVQNPNDININDYVVKFTEMDLKYDIIAATAGTNVPMFTYDWLNCDRDVIPAGVIPCDGQIISIDVYPTAVRAVLAGRQHAVTEEEWLADPLKRNSWSMGDGATFVRMPDLNGVHEGSERAFYLRGSNDAKNGTADGDAIRNITGTHRDGERGPIYNELTGNTGAFYGTNERSAYTNSTAASGYRVWDLGFDASKVVPTAEENRPKTANGIWVCRLFGSVENVESFSLDDFANRVLAVKTEVDSWTNENRAFASMFEYKWENTTRDNLAIGMLPCDGQMISALTYPDAVAAVLAGKQFAVTEAEWQADPLKRNNWSRGDGESWIRVPDLNGVQLGSNKAFYLRGGVADIGGTAVGDAIRNISGTLGAAGAVAWHGGSGAIYLSGTSTTNPNGAGGSSQVMMNFDASRVVPTADENRTKTAYGVWTVRVFGYVSNPGAVDALQLAQDYIGLDARVSTLETAYEIVYPNGTPQQPAILSNNQRHVISNPYPGHIVTVEAQILINNVWGKSPMIFSNGGYGAEVAYLIESDQIIVQSGLVAVHTVPANSGTPLVSTTNIASAPFRVLVIKGPKHHA